MRRLLLLPALLLALPGCDTAPQDDDTADDDDTTATCDLTIDGIAATVSEHVATVVTVTWTTDVDATCQVEFGPTAGLGLTAPEETAGTEHDAVLMGLAADTAVSYSVACGSCTSEAQSVTTGSLPAELPGLTAVGDGMDAFMLVPAIGAWTGPTIIDPDGNIVWYWPEDRELEVYRLRMSVDGESLLYNAASVSGDPAEDSELMRVSLDGSTVTPIPVPLLAHDFVELPDGTIAAIATEYRDVDGEQMRGDKLVEIAPDGTQTDVWSAWDCFDPEVHTHDDMDFGWTFCNAIDYDADEDAYYLGICNFSTLTKIPRSTYTCEWLFGGIAGEVDITGTPFMHEHQFHVLDGSIVIFDNDGPAGLESRAVEYAVEVGGDSAEEIWSYHADPAIYTFVLGDVHRFDDGDTLITWATAGQIDRVTEAGESAWRLNTDMGYAFGFNTVMDDLYAP